MEHKVTRALGSADRPLVDVLNEHLAQESIGGWELVAVRDFQTRTNMAYLLFWKRP